MTASASEDGREKFARLLQGMRARGFRPYYVAFLNRRGHARSLAHADIDDEIGFLRWLALDVRLAPSDTQRREDA